MTVDGGGWTQFTDTVSSTSINNDPVVARGCLYVRNGLWNRTPSSNLVWDWNTG